jgi:putative transposase
MMNFKGSHYEQEIIWGGAVVGCLPNFISAVKGNDGRGVIVDYAARNRRLIKYARECEQQFRRRQCPMAWSWRLDETYGKIKAQWTYLSRAVDTGGHTMDFLLTLNRDRAMAETLVRKAIRS